jgi:hypothetical protein
MSLLLALFLFAGVVPETTTGWMDPARLGISIGMGRDEVRARIESRGLKPKEGKVPEHLIVQLSEVRSVTLAFSEDDVLQSARFELIGFVPEIPPALKEIEKKLIGKFGQPDLRIARPTTLGFEKTRPNVYVTASTDPNTEFGKQGLGFLVVRYFAPPPAR